MERVSNSFLFESMLGVVRDVMRSKIAYVGVTVGANCFVKFLVSGFSDMVYVIDFQVRVKDFVTERDFLIM